MRNVSRLFLEAFGEEGRELHVGNLNSYASAFSSDIIIVAFVLNCLIHTFRYSSEMDDLFVLEIFIRELRVTAQKALCFKVSFSLCRTLNVL